ncbi:putative protein TPRXL [Selaginella moellendorffii]|uniref:putative protein TPRXL n=1 Tax=Selaginella moellendorffii TaxID=88036 RepID=UPI000D1C3548|nr:putative protein TPRXL [Selaginella moellendorffii]|eukprot:XP_024524989.1 putative protein TPRXL [Selaginella moellendorffii]
MAQNAALTPSALTGSDLALTTPRSRSTSSSASRHSSRARPGRTQLAGSSRPSAPIGQPTTASAASTRAPACSSIGSAANRGRGRSRLASTSTTSTIASWTTTATSTPTTRISTPPSRRRRR